MTLTTTKAKALLTDIPESLEALKLLKKTIPSGSYGPPILQGVYVSMKPEGIDLLTTDLETVIRVQITGEVESEGAVVIPLAAFQKAVDRLRSFGNTLTLESQEGNVEIVVGNHRATLHQLDEKDFPNVSWTESLAKTSLSAELVTEILPKIAKHASTDAARQHVLGGVCIDELGFIATDAGRLAFYAHDNADLVKPVKQQSGDILIPAELFTDILKLPRAQRRFTGSHFTLGVGADNVTFVSGRLAVSQRRIEAKFVDWGRAMIDHGDVLISLDNDESFRKTLVAQSSWGAKSKHFKVRVDVDLQAVTLSVTDDMGTLNGDLSVSCVEKLTADLPDIFEKSYPARQLIDALELLGDHVEWHLQAGQKACLLKDAGRDSKARVLVMPMGGK